MKDQLSIKAWRVNAELSQDDVADKLGVTRHTVMRWENGDIKPKGLVIYALAKLYNTEVDNIRT